MSIDKSLIIDALRGCGAVSSGFSAAEAVDSDVRDAYLEWLGRGCHGEMVYLERNLEVRFDPRLLLPEARTVVSAAFPYAPRRHHPNIADYALGHDYHYVLKARLAPVLDLLAAHGEQARVCVDSAPILERYWAARAGVGYIGENRQLIVPGIGSEVFLAEIVTTAVIDSDGRLAAQCAGCGACRAACPTGALSAEGFDSRLCRSYLTVEHRGQLPDTADLGPSVAGCDICQHCCPHNAEGHVVALDEFEPNPMLMALDREALATLSSGDWRRLVRGSALSRISYARLRRNLEAK